jgi:hypothetical protein
MKKRIAILYSGQPRHVKECWRNHNLTFFNANPDAEIDVFAHIWYDESWIGSYFWNEYKNRGMWEEDIKQFMLDYWDPKHIIFEAPKEFVSEDIHPDPRFPHPVDNIISMFYSIGEANRLKCQYEAQNNFKYDCVIRVRTDEYFSSAIGSVFDYDLNSINVLNEWAHVEHGINDHFAFGSSELMDKYLDVYDNFIDIVELGAEVNPECILGFNAQKRHNLPIVKHDWKYLLYRDL